MSVPVAYATILIIWSTTPLGIQWSNETLTPITAITIRMLIAAIIGYLILRIKKIELSWNLRAIKVYSVSLLGIYAAMLCTYTAAGYVPSGIISVIYALSPVISSLLAHLLIDTGRFSRTKMMAFTISFSGLFFIFKDDWVIQEDGWIGLVLLLFAVSFYSLSGVLVERQKYKSHPLSTTVGTLILSIPLYFLSWVLIDGELPSVDWSSKSPWAVIYLALAGSLLGFACYFFIIKELGATAVATVTLTTPVFALALGALLNHEPLSIDMLIGTGFILIGLVTYFQSAKDRGTVQERNESLIEAVK